MYSPADSRLVRSISVGLPPSPPTAVVTSPAVVNSILYKYWSWNARMRFSGGVIPACVCPALHVVAARAAGHTQPSNAKTAHTTRGSIAARIGAAGRPRTPRSIGFQVESRAGRPRFSAWRECEKVETRSKQSLFRRGGGKKASFSTGLEPSLLQKAHPYKVSAVCGLGKLRERVSKVKGRKTSKKSTVN